MMHAMPSLALQKLLILLGEDMLHCAITGRLCSLEAHCSGHKGRHTIPVEGFQHTSCTDGKLIQR